MAIVAVHDDILVAVEAPDEARARAALGAHFDEVGERYGRAFERLERSERFIGSGGWPERGHTDRQGMRVDAPRQRSESSTDRRQGG